MNKSLVPGEVDAEYLSLLYKLMNPAESPIRDAVFDHLCSGLPQNEGATKYNVHQGNISRQVKRLNVKHKIINEFLTYFSEHIDSDKI